MIKGNSVRVYYPVIQSSTGQRITGDSENHSIYVSQGAVLSLLNVTPSELIYGSGDSAVHTGEYTFELPASCTNTDRLVVIVKSSNALYDAVIEPIELNFDDPETSITSESIQAVVDSILGAAVTSGDSGTLQKILYDLINAIHKIETYPTYGNLNLGIETKEAIAQKVLTQEVTAEMCTQMNSLAAMLMGGFLSDMDPAAKTWSVKKPDGSAFFTKKIETDDTMKPIIRVYNAD